MYKLSDYKEVSVLDKSSEMVDMSVKMLGVMYEWKETLGKGIKVGIIDTGIDLNHSDLKGAVKDAKNFTSGDLNDVTDNVGHGTHVAGCIGARRNGKGIVGVAPECELYIAKAFDDNGFAKTDSIVSSLNWLRKNKVDVINMSFSSKETSEKEYTAIKSCYNDGIILVAAAGNDGPDCEKDSNIGYPAKFNEVIAVTAVDINKNAAEFSSCGTEAQVAAVGKEVLSTYKNNKYAVLSGTSMATPLISGAAAILQAKAKIRFERSLTPYEASLIIDMYADCLGNFGHDKRLGYGLFSFGRYFV